MRSPSLITLASLLLAVPAGILFPIPHTLFSTPLALAQATQDRKAEADSLFNQGIQQYQTSQFEAALQSWEQALQIYREIKDRQNEGATLGNLGGTYLDLGEYAKAIEYEQQALEIARELHNRQSEGHALVNLGSAYRNLGEYAKAIEHYQQALETDREIKDRQGEGRDLGNLGSAYRNLGEYAKAIEYAQQALEIARELHNRQNEGAALGNLGNAYDDLGEYAKAIEYEQQALEIARELHNRPGEGAALGNLGNAYKDLGNYAKAIEYYQQALEIAREFRDRQNEGHGLGNLGSAYYVLGNYAKAIEYYQQALGIAREIHDRQNEGYALGNLGNAYDSLGNHAKAIEYQQQALGIDREIHNRQGEGRDLGNLGLAYRNLGNYAKEIEYEQQWLVIAREIKDRQGEGYALGNLGNAYDALGNYAKAIEYEQQWLVIAREIKDRQSEGAALNNLGHSLLKSGQLAAADRVLREGIQTEESLRTDSGTDTNKISIFEEQTRTYRLLQQVFIAQHQPDAALEIAERGRARAFVELLTQRLGSQASGVKHQEPGVTALNVQQIQQIAKTQHATLVQYSIIYDEFKVAGQEQTHDAALYIWVVQPNGNVNFRQVDLKPLWQQQHTSLAKLVASARCFGSSACEQTVATRSSKRARGVEVVYNPSASDRPSSSISPSQSNPSLHQLHQLLIEPIADLLPSNPTAHVIFMPQDSLFLVPFAALQDKSNHYLIQQHTLSIAPSIQVLSLTHQQQTALPKTTPSVLVAGDPTMPKVLIPGENAPLTLPDLPGAKREALAVAKTLNTTALVGNQATKHAITQQMQTARLIHLATHGLLDDFKGLGVPGAIALAPDGTGQPNDGLLTADDILNLTLKAELVVLSACDTGQGRLTGDGVVGLSRSLISAGVPSVIVSLWSIPDAPTASLMTHFYQNLQQNPDKAQALRQAMLSTLKDHPNPIDWAAFTLIGEAQ